MDTDAFQAFWSFLVVEVKYYHKVTLLDSCQVDIIGHTKKLQNIHGFFTSIFYFYDKLSLVTFRDY